MLSGVPTYMVDRARLLLGGAATQEAVTAFILANSGTATHPSFQSRCSILYRSRYNYVSPVRMNAPRADGVAVASLLCLRRSISNLNPMIALQSTLTDQPDVFWGVITEGHDAATGQSMAQAVLGLPPSRRPSRARSAPDELTMYVRCTCTCIVANAYKI